MSQPPTGPGGYPPPYPPQPPAAPGQPPAGGTVYGAGQPAPQQYAGVPQSTPPAPPATAPAPTGYAPTGASYGGPAAAPAASGPGYGQPMSAPPMSGPPMSGPPMSGPPMSGPPGSVPPYGAAPAAAKGRTVLVLAVVAGLLFVLGGVMTGLFVTTSGKLDRTEKQMASQVSQRDGTIAANATEIEKLKADLQSVQDKLADTEQDLTGTRNDRDEQARQKKIIATCLDKLTTALNAAATGNRAAFDKANKGLDKVCNEAEDYL
ncbi:hypothetical protein GA0070609_4198 [Micromonospora echinaurantiaca]|uniref:Uncharacterized protein n=1 Tax=Micromonospora echinaurantiaca TaxID=47857 RepID=A0A1C5J9W0_9ACTN|nr:hypothetical protein [Micromonospora echinaurantiaca]SCG66939.1 hypothetical protein GA0070609_4198 [Micromonospora echinaurantiaca]